MLLVQNIKLLSHMNSNEVLDDFAMVVLYTWNMCQNNVNLQNGCRAGLCKF